MNEQIAIVLAGGSGERFGSEKPKQYLKLAGKPILWWSLKSFIDSKAFSKIYVCVNPNWLEAAAAICKEFPLAPIELVAADQSRSGSTLAAVRQIPQYVDERAKIVVHDAVRPFLDLEIIDRVLIGLDAYDCIDVVVPTADTIVMTDETQSRINHIPDRSRARRGQTPQGFRLGDLRSMVSLTIDWDLATFSCDCALFQSCFPQKTIGIALGSERNIKITTEYDMALANKLVGTRAHFAQPLVRNIAPEQVHIVLGGNGGIGSSYAILLEQQGAQVVRASRASGIDICNREQVSALLDETFKKYNRIDGVAIFSGHLSLGHLVESDPLDIIQTVHTNLLGPIWVAHLASKYLSKTKGYLMFTSSSSYSLGREGTAVYSATKAALVNLTNSLSIELHQMGISVICVVPPRCDTPMRKSAFGKEPPGSLASPDYIAGKILPHIKNPVTGNIVEIPW